MKTYRNINVALTISMLFSTPALAQDFGVSEIRGGIFSHSVDEPGTFMGMLNAERVQDINVELLFDTPGLTEWVTLGELRPHIGATLSLGGLENMVYAGVSWTVPLFGSPVFVEAAFGGAVHTGKNLGPTPMPARNLGCTLLFHEAASIGVQLTETASIMATIEHASNANLCLDNRGLTNMGIRLGWKF